MDVNPFLYQEAVSILQKSENIVVFTGAGVSAESGIPTFRDTEGLWSKFPPLLFATWPGLFLTGILVPGRLRQFLIALLEPIVNADPNPAHRAIAELEQHKQVTVITQNIDGLHQRAGSSNVLEVHGTLFETRSIGAHGSGPLTLNDLKEVVEALRNMEGGLWPLPEILQTVRPMFGIDLKGMHRPDVVLFGQGLPGKVWTASVEAVERCDCLLSVGTSGTVYPAAGLPEKAQTAGASIIGVGLEPVRADVWLEGPAGSVLPQLLEKAFG